MTAPQMKEQSVTCLFLMASSYLGGSLLRRTWLKYGVVADRCNLLWPAGELGTEDDLRAEQIIIIMSLFQTKMRTYCT